jgi:recombination protein RecA
MAKEKNTKSNSKHVEVETNVERDDLALLLQKALNKSNKDGSKACYFLDEGDNPAEIKEWVSTGSTLLDLAVSNTPHGGLPVGRVVILNGLQGTGKSLLCAHLIKNTQDKGGQSVFFDSEAAVDKKYWESFGVSIKNTAYVPFLTVEELFTKIEICIGEFRKANQDKLLTIFVDSVAAASHEAEVIAEHGAQGFNTQKSQILGKALRKVTNMIATQRILIVFTNQLRQILNSTPFGEKYTSPGGMALPYHASVIVRLSSLGKLKKDETIIGMKTQASVIKNRCGPNYRSAQFEIHYDSGIQDLSSWLLYAKEHNIITGTAAKYVWKRETGDELTFNTSKFVELMNDDKTLKEEFYQLICKQYIMEYRNPNEKIVENIEETAEEADAIIPED